MAARAVTVPLPVPLEFIDAFILIDKVRMGLVTFKGAVDWPQNVSSSLLVVTCEHPRKGGLEHGDPSVKHVTFQVLQAPGIA